ncbi:hypothetical protein FZC66_10370 [Priestia megaterium]|nr:hypothetical protein FZC66_10370 [Priestia megaterium]
MFGMNDLPKFLWSFLLVLPLVTLVHQLGHSVFALLFGGKVDFTIGRGKTIFALGKLKIKSIYFLDSFCKYEKLRWDNRFTHALVYAGGSIFNLLSIFAINGLIMMNVLHTNIFWYQFVYFSVYYIVFSLLPIKYTEDSSSDGRAIYDVLRYGKTCDPDCQLNI